MSPGQGRPTTASLPVYHRRCPLVALFTACHFGMILFSHRFWALWSELFRPLPFAHLMPGQIAHVECDQSDELLMEFPRPVIAIPHIQRCALQRPRPPPVYQVDDCKPCGARPHPGCLPHGVRNRHVNGTISVRESFHSQLLHWPPCAATGRLSGILRRQPVIRRAISLPQLRIQAERRLYSAPPPVPPFAHRVVPPFRFRGSRTVQPGPGRQGRRCPTSRM